MQTTGIHYGTTFITDAAYNELCLRLDPVRNWVNDTEEYIKSAGLDHDTFSPIWGEETLRIVAELLLTKNRPLIDRLRRIWWFSGWATSHYTTPETFPVLDPTYLRYQKLKSITPERFRYVAPELFSEAGWKEDGGIINHDVAIFQERIQYLYFSGIADYLDKNASCETLELGSGYGGMAHALMKSFPQGRHVLCDIPQALTVAFCYLNVCLPDVAHFAVTTNGIFHVNIPGKKVSPEEAFNTPNAYIYIPNYLLPAYEQYLHPNMIFNAMSLHEMHQKAIQYYCQTTPRLLNKNKGIFCEVNTHPGLPNVRIDDVLKDNFRHCLEIDLPSLACRPRIWSNYHATIASIAAVHWEKQAQYPLSEFFEFDSTTEFPFVDDVAIKKMISEQLGPYVGANVRVLPVGNEPLYGNHLRYIVKPRLLCKGRSDQAGQELVELRATCKQQREQLDKLQAQQSQVNVLQQELSNVYASRSWRCTAGLRKLMAFLQVLPFTKGMRNAA